VVDLSRVVDVSAWTPAGAVSFGSGFLVAPELVLTARHVVCNEDGALLDEPQVRLTEGLTPLDCRVVWPGRPDLDAALLAVTDRLPSCAPVRWGQLVASETRIGCEAAGFPASMEQDDQLRDMEHMHGQINAGTGLLGTRIYADVTSGAPGSGGWAGMSGAALWCGPLLVGVIAWDLDAFASRRLAAEPVVRLFADPDFRRLLGADVAIEAVELARPRPRLVAPAPAYLLRADAATARFRSRATELAELAAWCEGGGARVRLLTGPGGQGKTRLARELAAQLAARGSWVTQIDPEAAELPDGIRTALLLVVDYAETRPDQVGQIVLSAAANPGGTPVRILLLARGAGDWWDRLRKQTAELEILLAGALVDELAPLEGTLAGRAQAFGESVRDYAKALAEIGSPCAPPDTVKVPDLGGEAFGSVLRLQMTALALLLDSSSPSPRQAEGTMPGGPAGAEPVEDVILRHEARYWERTAARHGLRIHEHTLRRAVAAAALCGATGEDEALALLGCLRGLQDQLEDVRLRAARWLRDLYPAAGGTETAACRDPVAYWGSLQPDLLAEHLVASVVAAEPDFALKLLHVASAGQNHQALTLLTRASSTRRQLEAALTDLLRHNPSLATTAVRVATQNESPGALLTALTRLIEDVELSVSLVAEIANEIPGGSPALAHFGISIEEKLVSVFDQSSDKDRESNLPPLGISLNNLSNRLAEAGRLVEALGAIERAVTIREKLSTIDPDAYLNDLATSLVNLAKCLADVGRRADALAASERSVTIRERLAEARPDDYLPDLAEALNSLSIHLADMGRRAEGLTAIERAVQIWEPLAKSDPATYLPDLAMGLNNLSLRLGEADRRVEALAASERSVAIREKLSEAHADVNLPDLAASLSNLAEALAAVGRDAEGLAAEERSVGIREKLAEAYPDAMLPDLARSLNNLSVYLVRADRTNEGLLAIERAAQIYERLADANPDAHLRELAASLSNLALHLDRAGRGADALAAIRRSVTLHERLVELYPDAYLSDLARSLNNLAVVLGREGQEAEALEAAKRTVKLYAGLAASDANAFEVDLARSLLVLANLLKGTGEISLAVEGFIRVFTLAERRGRQDMIEAAIYGLHLCHSEHPEEVEAEYERIFGEPWSM
jgi:Trypsin-like peptidase domain/Tetratricopeptide repeat